MIDIFRKPRAAVDGDVEVRDIAAPLRVGAAAFVAGQGARLYSLDVFRAEKRGGPQPPRRTA